MLGLCLGMQLLFDSLDRARRRPTGSGLIPGEVRPLDAPRAQGAADGLEPGRRGQRESPLNEGLPNPTPMYHVHSFAARPERRRRRARDGRVRRRVRHGRGARQRLRRPVPSGEVGPGRAPAALRNFASAGRGGRMIFLPAIDIRDGKAVRLQQGHFDKETVYVDDPLEAARSWVEAGARSLHVVDLDGARDGEPANLEHLKRITAELKIPVQYGGGLRSIVSVRNALAAGATRVDPRHRRLQRHRVPRRGDRHLGRARGRGDRRARRARVGVRLDEDDADAPRGRDQADAGARRQAVRLHERRPRRDAQRPGHRRGQADRRGHPRPLDLLGRHRRRSRTCARCATCA